MLSSILIIYTGGTIGMKTDPATGVLCLLDTSPCSTRIVEFRRLSAAAQQAVDLSLIHI